MVSKEIKDNLVTYALVGAIGWLFSSIGDLTHRVDLQGKDMEYNYKNDQAISESLLKNWNLDDATREKERDEMKGELDDLRKVNQDLKDKLNAK